MPHNTPTLTNSTMTTIAIKGAPAFGQLALEPLGAGDLIDRTVRLYRQHFLTLLGAATPPVVLSAVGSVLWTLGWRGIPLTSSAKWLAVYGTMAMAGWLLLVGGSLFLVVVMGGASRNLVQHLLWGEPVAARTIYGNVRARLWGLIGAALVLGLFAGVVGGVTALVWLFAIVFAVAGAMTITGGSSLAGGLIALAATAMFSLVALGFFFWVVGRVAYVPQVMLVEGCGVFDAVGRSFTLARGNVRRLLAMFAFTTFATYSALMLLLIPLGWYGYLHGVNPFELRATEQPVWYAVGSQVLGQASTILLAPVWMLGLSLLYVDERVRHEGFDVELLAQQRLGQVPALPGGYAAPLAPALAIAALRRDAAHVFVPTPPTVSTHADTRA